MPASARLAAAVAALAAAAALASLAAPPAHGWRSPSNFEGSIGHMISAKDAQASREPDTATAPDGSLVAVWSDQFAMRFGRSAINQAPEFHQFAVSTIPGSTVPSGTAEDTSKPAVAVNGDGRVAVAYLFNFARSGGGNQHDVLLITGRLDGSADGVTWDTAAPQRVTSTETENARRVTAAYDHAGALHLAWEDAPDAAAPHVIRHLELGAPGGAVVISDPAQDANWPVLAADTGSPDRLHIAYTESGHVVERFAEGGSPRDFGAPTLLAGSNASRPDLAVLPPAGVGSGGTPIVVYDADAPCGKRQVFAVAPGVAATQLSDCSKPAHQEQATIAVRASDRTAYATWLRESNVFNASTGPLVESRLEAGTGWRWWAPIEVTPTSEVAGGWYRPTSTATPTGAQVLAVQITAQYPSGEEIVHASNSQLDVDAQGAAVVANPSGPGLKLSWTPFPNEAWHGLRIVRKPADDFAGPNDPAATVVGTLVTQIAVIGGEYRVVPGGELPSSFVDATASPGQSYVYKLYAIHRGPAPGTDFIESPGYRFGTTAVWGSPAAPAAVTPVPGAPAFEDSGIVQPVRAAAATAGDGRVDLAWTNPPTFDAIVVVRKAGSDPASPADGALLLDGTATALADTGLANGQAYRYAVWTRRGGVLSAPVRLAATPAAPPAPAPAPGGGSSSGSSSGGSSSGGGSSAGGSSGGGVNPDLVLTLAAEGATPAAAGDTLTLVARTANRGPGGAQGISLLVTLPADLELAGPPLADRGTGCTGTAEISCFLDFLTPPQAATVRIPVRVRATSAITVAARVTLAQADAAPADNATTLALAVATPLVGRAPAVADLAKARQLAQARAALATAQRVLATATARLAAARKAQARAGTAVRAATARLAQARAQLAAAKRRGAAGVLLSRLTGREAAALRSLAAARAGRAAAAAASARARSQAAAATKGVAARRAALARLG